MIARVYQAVNAVAAALAHDGVAKTRLNSRDNYLYRSIDDVLERLAPLLAQHKLCVLPRVLEREATDRAGDGGGLLVAVTLKVAFDLVSAEDGSCHTIEAFGEALDPGDKATAKAMQSAYKYAVLQAFCVPAAQQEDADARSHRLLAPEVPAAPAEGWERWCAGLMRSVHGCSDQATLTGLKHDHRLQLGSLQRENPALYQEVGDAFAARSRTLTEDTPPAAGRSGNSAAQAAPAAQPSPFIAPASGQKAQPSPIVGPTHSTANPSPPHGAECDRMAQPSPSGAAREAQKAQPAPARPFPAPRRKPRAALTTPPKPSPSKPNGSDAHG